MGVQMKNQSFTGHIKDMIRKRKSLGQDPFEKRSGVPAEKLPIGIKINPFLRELAPES